MPRMARLLRWAIRLAPRARCSPRKPSMNCTALPAAMRWLRFASAAVTASRQFLSASKGVCCCIGSAGSQDLGRTLERARDLNAQLSESLTTGPRSDPVALCRDARDLDRTLRRREHRWALTQRASRRQCLYGLQRLQAPV